MCLWVLGWFLKLLSLGVLGPSLSQRADSPGSASPNPQHPAGKKGNSEREVGRASVVPKGADLADSPDLQRECGLRSPLCVEPAGDTLRATLTQNVWGRACLW